MSGDPRPEIVMIGRHGPIAVDPDLFTRPAPAGPSMRQMAHDEAVSIQRALRRACPMGWTDGEVWLALAMYQADTSLTAEQAVEAMLGSIER